jgi:hypothetical protein
MRASSSRKSPIACLSGFGRRPVVRLAVEDAVLERRDHVGDPAGAMLEVPAFSVGAVGMSSSSSARAPGSTVTGHLVRP